MMLILGLHRNAPYQIIIPVAELILNITRVTNDTQG